MHWLFGFVFVFFTRGPSNVRQRDVHATFVRKTLDKKKLAKIRPIVLKYGKIFADRGKRSDGGDAFSRNKERCLFTEEESIQQERYR